MIALDQVHLSFADNGRVLPVLEDVSLQVGAGASCAVIGPSGCGKTSLLFLLAGLLKPTAGTVRVADRSRTGVILQHYGLLPWKSVAANIALGLRLQGADRERTRARVDELLVEMDLAAFADHFPGQLSGGMQQRVALARALATEPRLLLMDEPLSALDALTRERLQHTILGVWQRHRVTMVLVTHSIEEAVFLGQTVVVLTSRPARVAAVVDNPGAGRSDYRQSETFFHQCRQLRALIREHCDAV
ncbi:ABC transporter ATP-binding protein [uncultured Desulfobulbus sp.]|uniref:ABC transporter ATP-binding protein n=1 Tax=uncultured Desulfobulbus sp. TaxID=239745 RepID=UPI0026349940|nr:ABC transporter ATP-binding protein [uncultured Desulfobulbus sp.]